MRTGPKRGMAGKCSEFLGRNGQTMHVQELEFDLSFED